ncbi:hypothetical protein UFOVP742_35 [uncultured Caudovirales phage]|uniref:Uncharacterized protein n=1 Tax=uncultured Caudovirales phage TaxID=2100421 RepID=A0A6J7XBB0_9CAUD|nr:hypothetical protein UFOVP742_35 [uncultured Caudovirales phage]
MIKLRITTAGGTKIELDIPIDDSKPASIEPAVPYQPEPGTPVEVPTESQDEVVRMFDEPTPVQPAQDFEQAIRKYQVSPTFPSNKDLEPTGKRYTSVEAMVEDTCPEILEAFMQSLQQGEGEKGEDGRIGGVGERKEDGEKGKPEQSEAFTFEFPCKGGKYTPLPQLVKNHIATYGEQIVIEEYREAQNWLITNPQKIKTEAGTGKYLSGWLKRGRKFREEEARKIAAMPVRVHQKADNLLSSTNAQTQGW